MAFSLSLHVLTYSQVLTRCQALTAPPVERLMRHRALCGLIHFYFISFPFILIVLPEQQLAHWGLASAMSNRHVSFDTTTDHDHTDCRL